MEKELLTPQQEAFCQYYTGDTPAFNHLTKSYAMAYGYDIPLREDGKLDTTSKEYNICAVEGSRNASNPKIKARIQAIYDEKFNTDAFWDTLLTKIGQRAKGSDAVQAIKHRNELKQRITKKLDITTGGRPLSDLTDEELEALSK